MIANGYILSIAYVFVCLTVALLAYKLGAPKKITRKIVHILVGFEWVILSFHFGPTPHFLAVCLLFLSLLAIDYKLKLVPAMSSEGDNAPGTVYYAVAMTVMAAVTIIIPKMMIPFGIAVFCTSFGDGFAAIFGQLIKKRNPKIYGNKTLAGALVNFCVSFSVALVFSIVFGLGFGPLELLCIAVLSTGVELIADRGLDNILITISVSLLSYGLIYIPETLNYIVPVLLTPFVIIVVKNKRALTDRAIASALVLDFVVSVAFGNIGFCVLVFFLFGSVIADKIKKRKKNIGQNDDCANVDKSECRNIVQVIANGLTAAVVCLAFILTGQRIFVVAYVAAMAEALADTVASGVGALSDKVYDIFRFKKCEPGLSGGMSVLGTISALAAALLLCTLAFIGNLITDAEFFISLIAAFLGCVFDSMLGSLSQAKYKCTVCGKTVEKSRHCDKNADLVRGFSFITNDTVNGLSTVFSALISILMFVLII